MFPYCPVAEPDWAPLPRPLLPTWKPTWSLRESTIIQPCNSSGYMDPSIGKSLQSVTQSVALSLSLIGTRTAHGTGTKGFLV
eukprot:COSAG06_NODE_841_length_11989_cov_4.537763_15_plen_82_part_00